MRCLVTGASGHLGSFVVRRLLTEAVEIHALVRPQSDLWRLDDVLSEVHLHRAALDDPAGMRNAVQSASPDVTFHLAWQGITAGERNGPEQITGNVVGTLQLLDAVRQAGCKVWVGVGSQAEYGAGLEGARGEMNFVRDGDTQGVSAYGVSKLCAGLLSRKLCELAEMRCLWFRLLATYGPGDDERHLIPAVINQLLNGQRPALTLGEQQWDYLYVEDAAQAIVAAALADGVEGTFDLGSGQAVAVRDIVERIRDFIDPALPLGLGEIPYRADQVMFLQADLAPLQKVLDWAPQTSLDEGLHRTVICHLEERGLA